MSALRCATALLAVASVTPLAAEAPDPPQRSYYVYVAAESDDQVSVVRYGPGGAEVVKTITVGSFPAEVEGPHGLTVDPDGRHWYVSIAHGSRMAACTSTRRRPTSGSAM